MSDRETELETRRQLPSVAETIDRATPFVRKTPQNNAEQELDGN